jgi:NADPH2:quinone reductase
MKAILLRQPGDPPALEYTDVPTPRPRSGEALVRAHTVGVSRPELLVRRGVYQWMPKLPAIPGIEMTGSVVELGPDVSGISIGQNVFVSARELSERAGCYAEYIAVPVRALRLLPAGADLEAAACLSNYQVAYHLLHTATKPVAGANVLIHAGAGGLGSAAIELARLSGQRVIAVVNGAAKARALQGRADAVIDAQAGRLREAVLAITDGRGADLILDGAGGEGFMDNFELLADFGLIVSYGVIAGPVPERLRQAMNVDHYEKSPAVRFFTMHTMDKTPALRAESMQYLIARLAAGELHPLIHGRLPLAEAWRAHTMLEAREVVGKILLKP